MENGKNIDDNIKAKNRQKLQIIIGGIGIPLVIMLMVWSAQILIPNNQIFIKTFKDIVPLVLEMNIFLLLGIPMVLLFSGISAITEKSNYSYIKSNHIIILMLIIFKFIIAFDILMFFGFSSEFINFKFWYIGILIIIELFVLFFILNDDVLRIIYFKLIKIFHIEDAPYDKRYAKHSKLYFIVTNDDSSKTTKPNYANYSRIANSIDQFRLGQTSDFKIFGIPITPLRILGIYITHKKSD